MTQIRGAQATEFLRLQRVRIFEPNLFSDTSNGYMGSKVPHLGFSEPIVDLVYFSISFVGPSGTADRSGVL
jgi:hypothetical protein